MLVCCGSDDDSAALPEAPTNLIAHLVSRTQVDLAWTDNATNETGYRIQKKRLDGQFSTITIHYPNITVYSDTGLTLGQTYVYRVYSFNSSGNSINHSNEVTIITENTPVLTTAFVTSITATTAICGGKISSEGGSAVTARGVCWSTNQNPTLLDNKTSNGIGTGNFISSIGDLSPSTSYYIRAYAANSSGIEYGNEMIFTTMQEPIIYDSFVDTRDDNLYKLVTIGDQVWMAENLKYLPTVSGPSSGSQTVPKFYVYGYDGTSIVEARTTDFFTKYGVLYNWPAAMDEATSSTSNPSRVQGVCPIGWHLPSSEEWTQLTDYLGGDVIAAGKLKEVGTTHWIGSNGGSTNETGFTALPGGVRFDTGVFHGSGEFTYWWSASEEEARASHASNRGILYSQNNNFSYVTSTFDKKELGLSVRCVKD